MAKGKYDWSTTASDNDDADASIDWREGMAARQVNNSARAQMAREAQWLKEYAGTCTVGGSADAVTLTTSTTYTEYVTGLRLTFKPGSNNATTTPTLNVDGVGAKKIRKVVGGADAAVAAADLKAGAFVEVIYSSAVDGGSGGWVLMNPPQAPAGLTLISTASPSNAATVDFTGITSTYDEYELHLLNVIPATDGAALWFRTSTDGGSTFNASNGYTYTSTVTDFGSVTFDGSGGGNQIQLGSDIGSDANENGVSGVIRLIRPSAAAYLDLLWSIGFAGNGGSGYPQTVNGMGRRTAAADVDAVRFLFSTGNIESGVIRLYGVAK